MFTFEVVTKKLLQRLPSAPDKKISRIFAAVVFLSFVNGLYGLANVRLSNGWHGRLEVKQDFEDDSGWGTVCDDKIVDNNYGCEVVCYQLFRVRSGAIPLEAHIVSNHYGVSSLPIRLDEVTCLGIELNLDECKKDFWDSNNCGHSEDVGCICPESSASASPEFLPTVAAIESATTSRAVVVAPELQQAYTGTVEAVCGAYSFRIHEFDTVNYPGIGRAEFYNDDLGSWLGICDDTWSEAAAKIFCSCISSANDGMADMSMYKAFWSPQLLQLKEIDILSNFINCSTADMSRVTHVLDCPQSPIKSGCARSEAAGVACKQTPVVKAAPTPEVSLQCTSQYLTLCFTSSVYLNDSYLGVSPACPTYSLTSRKNDTSVCIGLDMAMCTPTIQSTDAQYKRYCYDISYAAANANPSVLVLEDGFLRRSCCLVEKVGRVSSSFQSRLSAHEEIQAVTGLDFKLECYSDEFSTHLPFPAQVTRGDTIFCKITGLAWDANLELIMPSCNLTGSLNGPPVFEFHKYKCPQTLTLGLDYYDFGVHSYGFRLNLPTFQSTNQVFLSCSVYMCDKVLDEKPYCDRTCLNAKGAEADSSVLARVEARRRRRDFTSLDQQAQAGTAQQKVDLGPFMIQDLGYGPMIMDDGTVKIEEPQLGNGSRARAPRVITASLPSVTNVEKQRNEGPRNLHEQLFGSKKPSQTMKTVMKAWDSTQRPVTRSRNLDEFAQRLRDAQAYPGRPGEDKTPGSEKLDIPLENIWTESLEHVEVDVEESLEDFYTSSPPTSFERLLKMNENQSSTGIVHNGPDTLERQDVEHVLYDKLNQSEILKLQGELLSKQRRSSSCKVKVQLSVFIILALTLL